MNRRAIQCCLLAGALATVGCGGGGSASFNLVAKNETAALLSVWGNSASDVWVVGGQPMLGANPTVLHFDGGTWSRVDTGLTGFDLWWVFGFVGGDIFFSGSNGTILRYHAGAFEQMITPAATGIVFGMWGPTPDDIWAVGRSGDEGGVILWHFDGTTWSAVAPPGALPNTALGFKVHGQSTNDVWVACSEGFTLHWDGSAFEDVQTNDPASLFSIVTTPTEVVTAGDVTQVGAGALFENQGSGWQPASLSVPYAWHGVAASSTAEVYAVGENGLIAHRDDAGAWSIVKQTLFTQEPFHGAWIDPDGGFWGVGGNFNITPLTQDGFLLYLGSEDVPALTP